MKNKLSDWMPNRIFLVFIFLLSAVSFIFYQSTHKQRIFILHSYHRDLAWVKNLERGVAQVFKEKRYVNLHHFYMNTKRRTSKAYQRRITREALSAIKRYQPDVLLVFDANAQKMVASQLLNKSDYKIVFAGVTPESVLAKFRKANNITGVIERIPVQAVKEVLALMLPEHKKRLFYLADNSMTAKQLAKDLQNAKWQPYHLVRRQQISSWRDWQNAVLAAQKKADAILLSTVYMVFDGRRQIPMKQLVRWTLAHSKIPVIGLYESFIENGGYLAISVASYEQGYTAAKIANFLLENKIQTTSIPFVNSQMFQLQLRKKMVKKFYPKLKIPLILEAFSKTKWQLDDVVVTP